MDIGKIGTELVDVNYWQPLYLPEAIDQSGQGQDWNVQPPLTLFWGSLPTFADLANEMSDSKKGVYFDPSSHLVNFDKNPKLFSHENLKVILNSSLLDSVIGEGINRIDISPKSSGNHTLGTNNGSGYALNPITNKPYKEQFIKKADFYRSLAEFWADGPESETPPGHWNVIANSAVDHPKFNWKWEGQGKQIDQTQYYLKLYLTLNGALHDSAIVAWGIKGHFISARPISVVRHIAKLAQTDKKIQNIILNFSDKFQKITKESVKKGERHYHLREHIGKIAAYAWQGPRTNNFEINYACDNPNNKPAQKVLEYLPASACVHAKSYISGVDWILLESWLPYQRITFVTPPFPGFISGHSTFSRAAAEVLAGLTGTPFFPGGLGKFQAPNLVFEDGPSEPFKFEWATYFDASDQSGISRIYGGIHASYDDLPARVIGSKIGLKALERQKVLFKK